MADDEEARLKTAREKRVKDLVGTVCKLPLGDKVKQDVYEMVHRVIFDWAKDAFMEDQTRLLPKTEKTLWDDDLFIYALTRNAIAIRAHQLGGPMPKMSEPAVKTYDELRMKTYRLVEVGLWDIDEIKRMVAADRLDPHNVASMWISSIRRKRKDLTPPDLERFLRTKPERLPADCPESEKLQNDLQGMINLMAAALTRGRSLFDAVDVERLKWLYEYWSRGKPLPGPPKPLATRDDVLGLLAMLRPPFAINFESFANLLGQRRDEYDLWHYRARNLLYGTHRVTVEEAENIVFRCQQLGAYLDTSAITTPLRAHIRAYLHWRDRVRWVIRARFENFRDYSLVATGVPQTDPEGLIHRLIDEGPRLRFLDHTHVTRLRALLKWWITTRELLKPPGERDPLVISTPRRRPPRPLSLQPRGRPPGRSRESSSWRSTSTRHRRPATSKRKGIRKPPLPKSPPTRTAAGFLTPQLTPRLTPMEAANRSARGSSAKPRQQQPKQQPKKAPVEPRRTSPRLAARAAQQKLPNSVLAWDPPRKKQPQAKAKAKANNTSAPEAAAAVQPRKSNGTNSKGLPPKGGKQKK